MGGLSITINCVKKYGGLLSTSTFSCDFDDEAEHAQEGMIEPKDGGQGTVRSSREYDDDKLKNYKNPKMNRKLPLDAQVRRDLLSRWTKLIKSIVKICKN